MGFFWWILSAIGVALALTSCQLSTNIPFAASGSSFELINVSSYELEVTLDGRRVNFDHDGKPVSRLKPGDHTVLYLSNFSTYSRESRISVIAWLAPGEKLAGAASRQISVPSNYARAETWIVRDSTIRDGW